MILGVYVFYGLSIVLCRVVNVHKMLNYMGKVAIMNTYCFSSKLSIDRGRYILRSEERFGIRFFAFYSQR